MVYDVSIDGKSHRLELSRDEQGWTCKLNNRDIKLDAVLTRRDVMSVLIDGKAFEVKRERTATDTHLWVGPVRFAAELRDPRSLRSRRDGAAESQGSKRVVAPMPGKVVRVLVTEKNPVEAGQGIVIVEAMKMQNELKSPKKGTVQRILVAEGAAVNAGDVLAIID